MSTIETLIVLHRDGSSFWAESDQIPGWTAAAADVTELLQLIHEGAPFALDCNPDDLDIRMQWEDGSRVIAVTANHVVIEGEGSDWSAARPVLQTATATG